MVRLFRVSIPVSVLGLLISGSILFFACYIFACYRELDIDPNTYLSENYGAARIGLVALAFVFGAYLTDLYTQVRVRSKAMLISSLMGLLGAALLCEAVIGYLNTDWALPKAVVVTGTVTALVAFSAWRNPVQQRRNVRHKVRRRFCSSAPRRWPLRSRHSSVTRPKLGMKLIGYLADEAAETNLPYLGGIRNVADVVRDTHPDRVVIAMTERRSRLPIAELLDLRFSGVFIEEATVLYEEAFGRVLIDEIRPSHLILYAFRPCTRSPLPSSAC